MVDTARFQLGIHAIRAVRATVAAVAAAKPCHPLCLATYLPLDVHSVARILDSFAEDGLITRADGLVTWIGPDASAPELDVVDRGDHVRDPGFIENLLQLRSDPDWCRRVREQHRVLRAVGTLGPHFELAALCEHAELPPPRARTVLGDLETEGFVTTTPSAEGLHVDAPDLEYPPDRFARNEALLSNVEARAVPVRRAWWITFAIAAVLLILMLLTRL